MNLNLAFLTQTNNNSGGGLMGMLPIILIVGIMIVFMVISSRKQKKQDQEIADMRNNLQVGDEITTIGGIIGKIVSIKDETCVIETSRAGTKIRILKTSVSHVDVKAEDAID